MAAYAGWTRADSHPFDPWLRVHQRLGAVVARIAPRSMRISGTLDERRSWTGMEVPISGRSVVPRALNPVNVDVGKDRAVYIEPNVWMFHRAEEAKADDVDSVTLMDDNIESLDKTGKGKVARRVMRPTHR